MKIEIEHYPSLIQSNDYWLSNFCVLGIKERKKRLEWAGDVKVKERHSWKEAYIGKR